MKPILSVVIVNFNGGRMLARSVESVRSHSKDCEIIIVDNNSSDGSVALLEASSDLRVIKLQRNMGFARANNIGIRASAGPYVVLLNSDTQVTPSWLDHLILKAEASPNIGMVGPKLLQSRDHSILDSTGHVFQFETGLSVDRGYGQVDKGQFDSFTDVPSCCFACVLIKRIVFEQIGLLDEKMFFYYEDVDFGLRARIAGWRVVYCPDSIVYHARHGSTIGGQRKKVRDLSQPYPLRIMLKNYQVVNMLRYAGRRALLNLLRIVAGVKNSDSDYAERYARELSWNLIHFPIKERILLRKLRKIPDRFLFSLNSL